jgi:uncharacterized protein YndB with AHSA1/START domain
MKSDVKISGRRLQITRVFDAPRPLVYAYWTRADKMQLWSGCKETTQCEIEMDFRPGGNFRQKMNIAGVGEFTITGTYDEITEPERIAYHVNLGPAVTSVVVEFVEQGKQTKVVLTQDGLPDEFLCKTVSQGTSEGLDKLERLLAAEKQVA